MSIFVTHLPEMIGLTILHSLWEITFLWIVLVAVLRLCPKASSAVRYTLAISTLMLSVLTTTVTAVYEWQSLTTSTEISALADTTQSMHTTYTTLKQTLLSRVADAVNTSVPILAWLWCAGLVVMGVRFGGSVFYLRKLRARENIAATLPAWEHEVKRLSLALGLRREVAIATSMRVSSPLTLGSLSPIILLPPGLLSGMSTAQIEAILVHELYHIKRRDYIINICQALVEVLLFYHPAIWHINNIIREERENCCDDQTLAFCGDAITYARALTQIQEINTLTKPTLAMSATGPNAGNFSNRIKRLFNIYPNPSQARSKGIFAIGFLIVYLGIVLASANISTARTVEGEAKHARKSINDHNTFSNPLSDSKPVSASVPDGQKVTHRPVARKTVRSIDIHRADTTVTELTLAECGKKVRALIATLSYILPSERFKVTKLTLEPEPTRFYRTINFLRNTHLDSIVPKANEATNDLEKIPLSAVDSITSYNSQQAIEPFGDDGKGVAVQVFPNSTDERLSISFTPARNNSRVKMVLVDSDGKVVNEITDSTYDNIPAELDVDVSSYKKGIYILQINIDGAKSQQRVVVD